MGLVAVDTDVLAIHHVFTWDQRYRVNEKLLRGLEEPATTIHNLLELVGIVSRAHRGQTAARIYRSYMLSRRWSILFPGEALDWSEYCDSVYSYLEKGMGYGDALIAWTVDDNADMVDLFVTWNKRDFEGRLSVPVYTPEELLKEMKR